jgi:predicted metal-dependent hydrolase
MGQVELVVPRGVSERQALRFLQSRQDWVRHHVSRRQLSAPVPQAFPPATIALPLVNEDWRVFQAGGPGRLRLQAAKGRIDLRGTGSREQLRRVLLRWLTERAQAVLTPQLAALAAQHGFTYHQCQVRRQRSRWGSCSSRGVVSLNVALLFQRAEVVRYLLCHELAHTRHMNHSRAFWRCVAECEPDFRSLDAELVRGWSRVPAWVHEIS